MTVAQLKADSMIGRRLPTMLLGGFAVLAMLLACAGIYGVLSFVTASRTQELGIRAALGASRWNLVRMVLGGGARPVLAGYRHRSRRRDLARPIHSIDAVPDQPARYAQPDCRRRPLPRRRPGRVLRPCLARLAPRPDVGAQTSVGTEAGRATQWVTSAHARPENPTGSKYALRTWLHLTRHRNAGSA